MLLECPHCHTKNYLDPYPFWNFAGKIKCAGCGAIWYVELKAGHRVKGPDPAEGAPDLLPGYAETRDWRMIEGSDKVRAGPRARPDFQGKPIAITRNIRGRLVSGRPLKPEELVGSRARFIVEGKE